MENVDENHFSVKNCPRRKIENSILNTITVKEVARLRLRDRNNTTTNPFPICLDAAQTKILLTVKSRERKSYQIKRMDPNSYFQCARLCICGKLRRTFDRDSQWRDGSGACFEILKLIQFSGRGNDISIREMERRVHQ